MPKTHFDQRFFARLKDNYAAYDRERREIIKIAGDALTKAKQAIFSFHRNDVVGGKENLRSAESFIRAAALKFKKIPELGSEGSYRAALEEYTEARLFETFLEGKPIGQVSAPGMDEDIYLGGLFDLTGELVRYGVLKATERDKKEVQRAGAALEEIAGEIISMNITGSLRAKYDQMKQNLRKMEEIRYDLSMRS